MSRPTLPLARTTDLNVASTGQEILIFDHRTDKAYVLSPSAAAIWRACDGKRTPQAIARYLSQDNPTSEQTVWYALGQLQDLLEEPVEIPPAHRGISRRQFLKRAGLLGAAAAVPVVVSIVAPPAAHAQSVVFFCCLCDDIFVSFVLESCDTCDSQCSGAGGQYDCFVLGTGAVCS